MFLVCYSSFIMLPCSVLIVDDEKIIRDGLLSLPWDSLGFSRVEAASDGVEAMEILSREPVDLLVTDVQMPLMDGLALCKGVRERWPQTKAVVLTGFRDFEFVKEALQARVLEYLLKPIDPSELEAVVLRLKAEIDEEHRLRIAPGRTPSAFAVIRVPAFLEESVLVPCRVELVRVLGEGVIGQTHSGADLILFLDQGITPTVFSEAARNAFHPLGDVGSVLVGWGETYQAALAALDRGFYHSGGGGFEFWSQAPEPLNPAPEKEADLVRAILEGRTEDVAKLLESLREAWGVDRLPSSQELKDRVELVLGRVREVMERSSLPVPAMKLTTGFSALWEQLTEFFTRAAEEVLEANSGTRSSSRWAVMRAVRHIEENLAKPLTLGELAQLGRLNPSYFSIQFKKEMGMNYVNFIKRARVNKASSLLHETDLKVYEVALAVGYTDTKHFTEVFREISGITPLAYRRKIVVP